MGWLENEAEEVVWDLKPFTIFKLFIIWKLIQALFKFEI
jgi:hypothetical protein